MKSLLAASTVALLACVEASTTTTTAADLGGAQLVPTEDAIGRITRAQCARVEACGAVPSRGVYRGFDYCDTDLRRETKDELLGGARCDYVDTARLATCIDVIQRQSCAMFDETRERPPAVCRRARLCR